MMGVAGDEQPQHRQKEVKNGLDHWGLVGWMVYALDVGEDVL